MKVFMILTLLVASATHRGHAQTVPTWTAEVVAGSGSRSDRLGSLYFEGDRSPMLRAAVSYRLTSPNRSGAYVKGELSAGVMGDVVLICRPAPNGGCRAQFEDNDGVGFASGIRYAASRKVVLGAAVGAGYYGSHPRGFGETDVALALGSHVALIGASRYMVWRRNGGTLWFAPITLGLQAF